MTDRSNDRDAKTSDTASSPRWRMARRGFLIGMGVGGLALAIGIPIGLPVARRKLTEALAHGWLPKGEDLDPLLWIELLPDDRIRLFVPKAEMGQGIHTGLAQIAAEELEVPWDRLEVVHATTRQGENKYRGTFGSMSIKTLYDPLRRASATMREMLRTEAARRLQQPADKLVARAGYFELEGDARTRIAYGSLVGEETQWQEPKTPVTLKRPNEFKLIGKPMPRVDGHAKVTGQAIFGHDVRNDKMLFGAVLRPPTFEAQLIAAKPGKAASMPGVVNVVIEKDFAGVVTRSRAEAWAARDALEATWNEGHLWQQRELEEFVRVGGPKGVTIQREGHARRVLEDGPSLTAEYRTGLVSHALLETQAGLAAVNKDGGRVWASTQAETMTARQVAKALDVDAAQIEIIPTFLGGGFGRKVGDNNVPTAAAQAARLSRAVGALVQVIWDRDEEMRHGYVRPMTHHKLAAKIRDGRLEALEWQQASGDSVLGFTPAQELIAAVVGFDPGAASGAFIYYAVPHREVTVWRRLMPLATGQWRGLGAVPNTFAIECFIDEVAAAAKEDPLQFRLDHLAGGVDGERMAAVLNGAAERTRWGSTPPAGRGRGLACCIYHGTVVAEIAEVSVNASTGQIRVHRVVAAMDCGRVINPDQVRSQMEGCVVMGASGAVREELTVKDGRIEAQNFHAYPLFTMADAPEIETILIEPSDISPKGCGEPPIAPVAPAIANAFFALTGVRLRQMPMSPSRVLAALKG